MSSAVLVFVPHNMVNTLISFFFYFHITRERVYNIISNKMNRNVCSVVLYDIYYFYYFKWAERH